MSATVDAARERVDEFRSRVKTLRDCLHQVVVGQDETIDSLLICAVCRVWPRR
jgi:MoxR-like ATPase